ncbi:MAG: c-type cytochrome [Chitinophagaceae bacterium]
MIIIRNKKTLITASALVLLCAALSVIAQEGQRKEQNAKNLKVLPADISHDDLGKHMDFFCASLNVKCSFCHADSKTRPGKLDFASDSASRHKQDAREMIEMTYGLNEKYFGVSRTDHMSKQVVNCYTCHRGEEMPLIGFDSIAARRH